MELDGAGSDIRRDDASESGLQFADCFLSRTDALSAARRVTSGLAALGVGPGDTVALLLHNDPVFLIATLGVRNLGAFAVPINWHWSAREVHDLLDDCGATVVFVHSDLVSKVPPNDARRVLVVAPSADDQEHSPLNCPAGALVWTAWLGAQPEWRESRRPAPPSMIYTSGTTGRPKGVRREAFTREQVEQLATFDERMLGLGRGARTAMFAPLYHSAPNAYALTALLRHGFVDIHERFDPEHLLSAIERHRLTTLQLVPTHFVRLLALPAAVQARYDLSSLQHVVHSASPCPSAVKRQMIDWWGPIIHEYYGSTETGPVTACNTQEWLDHPGTVGRPILGTKIRILTAHGSPLPRGESGEVYLSLPLQSGFTYHGDDEKRREVERDGFITVGDIGYVDVDGFLYINDRKKDMVISGGVNIYPAEIENELVTLTSIRDCAVFGVPDAEFGERLVAAIELSPGAKFDEQAVRNELGVRLARYMVPAEFVIHDRLPREDSGKILKRKLRDRYWQTAGRSI